MGGICTVTLFLVLPNVKNPSELRMRSGVCCPFLRGDVLGFRPCRFLRRPCLCDFDRNGLIKIRHSNAWYAAVLSWGVHALECRGVIILMATVVTIIPTFVGVGRRTYLFPRVQGSETGWLACLSRAQCILPRRATCFFGG